MEVQDPLKWTVRSSKPGSKPGLHHPGQVGRHWWTVPRYLLLEMYKILNTLIRSKNKSVTQ